MGEGDSQQSLWNFDGAELQALFTIKAEIISRFINWDLDAVYWRLRDMRRELDAKFGRGEKRKMVEEFDKENKKDQAKTKTEKQDVDDKLRELDNKRTVYIKKTNPSDEEKSSFYLALEEFYMHLCFLMKKHGLYFRETEDSRLAVLRR